MDFILKNLDANALQTIFNGMMQQTTSSVKMEVVQEPIDAKPKMSWNLPRFNTEQWIWIIIIGMFLLYAIYRILYYVVIAYVAYLLWKAFTK